MTRYLAGLRLRVRELFTNLKDFKCFDFQPHDSKLIVVLQIYTQTAIQKLINEPFLLASCFRFMFYATMTRDNITVVTSVEVSILEKVLDSTFLGEDIFGTFFKGK